MNNCRQEEMIRAGLHVFGWLIFPEPVLISALGSRSTPLSLCTQCLFEP
jgi:hypothetical protein